MFEFRVLLFICASVLSGFALECGINVNGSEDQFRELTNLCAAGNKSVVTDKPRRTSSEEDDDYNEDENSECLFTKGKLLQCPTFLINLRVLFQHLTPILKLFF